MAILAVTKMDGVTSALYDQVQHQLAGDRPTLKSFPGMIFHTAVATPDGFHIYDIWESEEAFTAFMQASVAPVLSGMDNPPTPQTEILSIYNIVQ